MSAIVFPIHIEAVGLSNVRFFAPPSHRRQFPWVALDDAMHCFSIPSGMREQATRDLQQNWKGEAITVATADGLLVLVPHYMVQGMAQAMIDCGRASPDLFWKYTKGGSTALKKLLPGVDGDDLLSYLKDAMEAGGGVAS